MNSARDFDASVAPTIYIENHDHGTVTCRMGWRDRWYKAQPYMIALATCSGTVLMHNGQEWGQLEEVWEDDSNAPPQFKRVQSRPLRWSESDDAIGQIPQDRYRFLFGLRNRHNGLRSTNFYPNDYDWSLRNFSPEGYGIDEARQLVIYHRWGHGRVFGAVHRRSQLLRRDPVRRYPAFDQRRMCRLAKRERHGRDAGLQTS